MSDAASVLMIAVFVMASLVVYLTIINALDRRANNRRIDDLLTRLMARDVPEYVNAAKDLNGVVDPNLIRQLQELEEARAAYDGIPVT